MYSVWKEVMKQSVWLRDLENGQLGVDVKGLHLGVVFELGMLGKLVLGQVVKLVLGLVVGQCREGSRTPHP